MMMVMISPPLKGGGPAKMYCTFRPFLYVKNVPVHLGGKTSKMYRYIFEVLRPFLGKNVLKHV